MLELQGRVAREPQQGLGASGPQKEGDAKPTALYFGLHRHQKPPPKHFRSFKTRSQKILHTPKETLNPKFLKTPKTLALAPRPPPPSNPKP